VSAIEAAGVPEFQAGIAPCLRDKTSLRSSAAAPAVVHGPLDAVGAAGRRSGGEPCEGEPHARCGGGRGKRGDDGMTDRYPWAPARKGGNRVAGCKSYHRVIPPPRQRPNLPPTVSSPPVCRAEAGGDARAPRNRLTTLDQGVPHGDALIAWPPVVNPLKAVRCSRPRHSTPSRIADRTSAFRRFGRLVTLSPGVRRRCRDGAALH
jgi:hypothetical protein